MSPRSSSTSSRSPPAAARASPAKGTKKGDRFHRLRAVRFGRREARIQPRSSELPLLRLTELLRGRFVHGESRGRLCGRRKTAMPRSGARSRRRSAPQGRAASGGSASSQAFSSRRRALSARSRTGAAAKEPASAREVAGVPSALLESAYLCPAPRAHSARRRSGCLRTKRRMLRQCHSVCRVRKRRSETAACRCWTTAAGTYQRSQPALAAR